MYGIVYKITNIINGKVYVGVTTKTLQQRLHAHLNKGNKEKSVIQKSLKKYGVKNFIIEQIDTANSKEELFEKERFYILKYDSLKNGYNLTLGGDGITNMTQEIKDKISKSKMGKSIAKLKNRIISEETRKKISKSLGCSSLILFNNDTNHLIKLEYLNECKKYGFSPGNVSMCLHKKRTHTKGYKVYYANPDLITEVNLCGGATTR